MVSSYSRLSKHHCYFSAWRRCVSTKEDNAIDCWRCGRTLPLPNNVALFFCLCDKKVLLPPTTTNYFKIFGCQQSYIMDMINLRQKYMELQRELHPDVFSTKSETEVKHALKQSALVNKAYSTLRVPYTRGIYLLEILGFPMVEDDNTMIADVQFLEEIIKINEELSNIREEKSILAIKNKAEACLQELDVKLSTHFEEGDLLAAKETLKKIKYYININEKALSYK